MSTTGDKHEERDWFYQLKWRSKMLEATRDMERTVDTLVISSS